jgi:hypothetical protein
MQTCTTLEISSCGTLPRCRHKDAQRSERLPGQFRLALGCPIFVLRCSDVGHIGPN